MSTVLRSIEFLCLGLWLGSDVFLSFVVAPGAFRVLGSRDAAGAMVGFALGRMHLLGVICGVVFLLARLARRLVRGWRCCGCRWVRSKLQSRIVRCLRSSVDCTRFLFRSKAECCWPGLRRCFCWCAKLGLAVEDLAIERVRACGRNKSLRPKSRPELQATGWRCPGPICQGCARSVRVSTAPPSPPFS